MASSDMASIDPYWSWSFRPPSFIDPWRHSDAISPETQTAPLQQSLSTSDCFSTDSLAAEALSPFFSDEAPATAVTTPTPVESNASGPTKSRRSSIPAAAGKVSKKRKPRKSKQSQITFINADPANFRQMVQQITGARVDGAQLPQTILKPEPRRPGGGRVFAGAGAIQSYAMQTVAVADSGGGGSGDGLVFNSVAACFPTLESWNAM